MDYDKPVFQDDKTVNMFEVIFPLVKKSEKKTESSERSSETGIQKSIQKTLELVKQNSLITISELAQQTGLSDPGIKKHLRKLQQQGLLKRVGPDKGGHWKVSG